MTEHQLAVRVTEVHSVALAPFPVLAVGAVVFPHPIPVTVGLEAMLPDIHKIILVDVALVIVRTDARAGGDRTVNQHGTDSNTGLAGIEMIPHITLIRAEEAFATITGLDPPLLSGLLDEIQHPTEHLRWKLKIRIQSGAALREYGEKPPFLQSESNQKFF